MFWRVAHPCGVCKGGWPRLNSWVAYPLRFLQRVGSYGWPRFNSCVAYPLRLLQRVGHSSAKLPRHFFFLEVFPSHSSHRSFQALTSPIICPLIQQTRHATHASSSQLDPGCIILLSVST
jgi:hypothetical protein